jgi:hypothetical protein
MKQVTSKATFLLVSVFNPEDGGIISQKIELFISLTFLQPKARSVSYIPDDVSSG